MQLPLTASFFNYQLENIFHINPDILSLTCRPRDQHPHIDYQAGQYVQVRVNDLAHPGILPLSIANARRDDAILEFHLRYNETQNAVRLLIEQLKKEPILQITGPHGAMTASNVRPGDTPLLLLAGGTGIAPFKGLLEHWAQFADTSTKPIHLIWGISKPEDFYLAIFLEKIKKKLIHFSFEVVLSQPKNETTFLTGFLDEHLQQNLIHDYYHQVYLSGPYPMVQKCCKVLLNQGLTQDAILSDMLPTTLPKHAELLLL